MGRRAPAARAFLPVIACVVAHLAFACAKPGSPPRADPPPSAEALIENLAETAARRQALRGSLKLSLVSPDLRFRRPQRLAVERPTQLRVETLGLLGEVVAVVVTDGDRYQVFDARTRELEEGEVGPGLLWEIARVDLSPAEVVQLLLGAPLVDATLEPGGSEWTAAGGPSMWMRDGAGRVRQRFSFDAEGRLLGATRIDADGDVVWDASWSDFRDVGGQVFPFEIDIDFPRVNAQAKLDFRHVEIGPELDPSLFRLN